MKKVALIVVAMMISSSAIAQQYYSTAPQSCGCNSSYVLPAQAYNVTSTPVYSQNVQQPMVTYSPQPAYSTSSNYYGSNSMPVQSSTYYSANTNQYPIQSSIPVSYSSQPYAAYSQPINSSAPVYSTGTSFPSTVSSPVTYQVSGQRQMYSSAPAMSSTGLAQSKAQQAAQMNLRGHVGGGLGGAKYEGVGWSTISPNDAIQRCCYWGTRPVSQIGVSKGQDGCWYACVLYQ